MARHTGDGDEKLRPLLQQAHVYVAPPRAAGADVEANKDIATRVPGRSITPAALALSVALSALTTSLVIMGLARGGTWWRDPGGLLVYPDCVMGLGGGAALRGGSFTHFTWGDACKAQLNQYFENESGVYYQQVRHVATAAINYMQNLSSHGQKPSPDQVFVFDIDETALSNSVEWMDRRSQQQQQLLQPGQLLSWPLAAFRRQGAPHVAAAAPAGSNQTGLVQSRQELGDAAMVEGDERPPLTAVRDLFWWLLEHNYSVAFITGRKESGRAWTAHNLLTAGYGDLCPEAQGARVQRPAAGVGKRTAPCYVALHLRDEDDDRPASVYKPERRKALEDAGYTVVGNIGDQFSDLEGLHQGGSSWKLPNPMYLIL